GGSTPKSLYELLVSADEPFRGRIPWEKLELFWGDERHVPPDHPDSNFRMALEAMLDRVAVPPGNIHRIHAELPDAAAAAAAYETTLRTVFALAAGGWPRFDLVLLGLGEEGHTASLFPGSPLLGAGERRLAAAPWVPAQNTFRITLTPPVLNQAGKVLFMISGAPKAPALRHVLEGEYRPEVWPAQIVRPVAGSLIWLLDRAAASELSSLTSPGALHSPG
ncbi:MAG: 6-phosphogluconolactonase, partial [Acidobacteriota bacterium]|nr:6-phosphogluconolactonase [Acidobacteriota bacterium]